MNQPEQTNNPRTPQATDIQETENIPDSRQEIENQKIPPLSQKPSTNLPIIIIAGSILIIILGTLLAYVNFYSKKSPKDKLPTSTLTPADPTADWKTYSNNSEGFSIRYPQSWHNVSYSETTGLYQFSNSEDRTNTDSRSVIFSFTVIPADGIWEELYSSLKGANPGEKVQKSLVTYTKIKDLLIDQEEAVEYSADYSNIPAEMQSIGEGEIILKKGERIFHFALVGNSPEAVIDNKTMFNQILSTFRFLPNTSDWKTYTNEKLGISFAYPTDFIVEDEETKLLIHSPYYMCREKGSGNKFKNTSEMRLEIRLHQGKSFNEVWKDAFGFAFTGENSYDGTEIIDSKTSYYFAQGAEMAFGRKAYLVEIAPQKALEVNIYTPSYTFECESGIKEFTINPKYTEVTSQILSTFQFLNDGNKTICSSDSDCPQNYFCNTGESCPKGNPIGSEKCFQTGDQTCFKECGDNSDCSSSEICKKIILYKGAVQVNKNACQIPLTPPPPPN